MRVVAIVWLLSLGAALPSEAAAPADLPARILTAHNAERTALNLPPLTWSDTLVASAAVCANRLAEAGWPLHKSRSVCENFGINLWMGTAAGFTVEQMVGRWTEEKHFFRNGPFPDVRIPGDNHAVGHYSQMVWKSTSEVGCAMATAGGWDVLVCRYSPAGNVVGDRPF